MAALPYPAITKIPNTEPAAIPALWNGTYAEIDSNFGALNTRLNTVEATMVTNLAGLGVTVTAAKINFLSAVTGDVQAQIDGKFAQPVGTTAQYVRGDGSLAAFPTTWQWSAIANKPTTFATSGMTLAATDVPVLNQNTTGSAATLTTARTLTIGASGKTFNGSANVAWTLAEIGAAAAVHTHVIGDVTGLQSALDSKATGTHNHTLDSLSNVTTANVATGDIIRWNGLAWVNATLASAGIAAAVHTHAIGDVTGLQAALDGKLSTTGTAAAATKLATARTLTLGATARGFDGTGNLSWTVAELGAAAAVHTHVVADVTGLQTALDGKSPTTHNHTLDSLTNVSTANVAGGQLLMHNGVAWVNATLAGAGVAAAVHTHVIADVTGLQGALNGKLDAGATAVAAGRWATARSVQIGATARSVDGTANLSWSLAEIGAAGTGANTFTGVQTMPGLAITSSRDIKEGIDDLALTVSDDVIDLFRPVTFRFKADPSREVIGLILEEAAEVLPQVAVGAGIAYEQIVPVLIARAKRDRASIRALAERVEALEAAAA
jgi:hypothetical protein